MISIPVALPSNGLDYSPVSYIYEPDLNFADDYSNSEKYATIIEKKAALVRYSLEDKPDIAEYYIQDIQYLWYQLIALGGFEETHKIVNNCYNCGNVDIIDADIANTEIAYFEKDPYRKFKFRDLEFTLRDRKVKDNLLLTLLLLEEKSNIESLIDYIAPQIIEARVGKEIAKLNETKDVLRMLLSEEIILLFKEAKKNRFGFIDWIEYDCSSCNAKNYAKYFDDIIESYPIENENKRNSEILNLKVVYGRLPMFDFESAGRIPYRHSDKIMEKINEMKLHTPLM